MIVDRTEHAHLIPKNANGQRGGVLGVLSDLGETLRLLPEQDDCETELTVKAMHQCSRCRPFVHTT